MNIKTRILLAVFVVELAGYGILLYHSNSQTRASLVDIRDKYIHSTISDNLHKIDNLTRLMEHKAIELAYAGQLLYNAGQNKPKFELDQLVQGYLIDSFVTFKDSIGGGLWFEPFVLNQNSHFYGPYVYWNNRDEVVFTWDLNTPQYNYLKQDWYLTALPEGWPRDQRRNQLTYWTQPYWDEAGSMELMMTVDAIMYSKLGEIIGLSTVDWSLQEMTNFIRRIKITQNTHTFLIDSISNKVLSNDLNRKSRMLDFAEVSWLKGIDVQNIEIGKIYEGDSVNAKKVDYKLYYLKSEIGLILGVMIPENELYYEIDQSAKRLVTSGGVIIGIFILSMLFFLDMLFRPFKKVKELIVNSIHKNSDGKLSVSKVIYEQKNEFTEIVDALNLTHEQINQYTQEIELAGKAKTTFLTTMSHEIRTPMNGILGYTQLLALDENIPQRQKDTLSAIESSGNHLLSLLNDVLDISKIESGAMLLNKEDVCLAALFEEINGLFKLRCKMEGLQWHFECDIPDNLILYTDGAKIKQIIINLLGNSIKFTNAGFISLFASVNKNILKIELKDTGVGINKSHQSELFTPFFQSNAGLEYGGTGLGLAIVKKLVELLDGDIVLVNSTDNGTEFEVCIPAKELEFNALKNKVKPSLKLTPGKFKNKGLKALVVDDVKFNRAILVSVLQHMNIDSVEACDGLEALTMLDDFVPDVIFIDIQMPVMDGEELMKHIKDRYPKLVGVCIAISANVYNDDEKYHSLGFSLSLSKPFKIIDVERMLEKIFS
ncbi:MAG: response regulator [Saccharospirillaceae bacterium]|nr:ATP-binding protein [Pseudomonadales bacterium]NRB80957.1 response regulator [Saccharospirillaceae bacterium]